MKHTLLSLSLLLMTSVAFAQDSPINFEDDGTGAAWTWEVFENGTNPPLEIIDNPDANGNTTAKVAKITAVPEGASFAGTITRDITPFKLDATNNIIKFWVWKSVISDVGIKLETSSGWSEGEIKVANTVTGEWEQLTFDFSTKNNNPEGEDFTGFVVFPDFAERTDTNVVYFDEITFSDDAGGGGGGGGGGADTPTVSAPTPTLDAADVLSIFSDAYTNVAGTNFDPDWGQATDATLIEIAPGDTVVKMSGLNYQGTEFASALDVSGYEKIHMDMWSAEATTVQFFLISTGPVETPVSLTSEAGAWKSFDFALTDFTNVDLADVIQFKVDDGGSGTSPTIFFDNAYFYNGEATSNEIVEVPAGFELNQNYPNPFNPSTNISFNLPVTSDVTLEVFNMQGQKVATLVDGMRGAGEHSVAFDASQFASGVYVYRLVSGSNVQIKKMMLIK